MPRPGLVKKRRAQMTHAKLDINHEEHTHTHTRLSHDHDARGGR